MAKTIFSYSRRRIVGKVVLKYKGFDSFTISRIVIMRESIYDYDDYATGRAFTHKAWLFSANQWTHITELIIEMEMIVHPLV